MRVLRRLTVFTLLVGIAVPAAAQGYPFSQRERISQNVSESVDEQFRKLKGEG